MKKHAKTLIQHAAMVSFELKTLIVGAREHIASIQGIVVDPIRGNLAPMHTLG